MSIALCRPREAAYASWRARSVNLYAADTEQHGGSGRDAASVEGARGLDRALGYEERADDLREMLA